MDGECGYSTEQDFMRCGTGRVCAGVNSGFSIYILCGYMSTNLQAEADVISVVVDEAAVSVSTKGIVLAR